MTRTVTRTPMTARTLVFHWSMMLLTCGLWTPVYLNARRRHKIVSTTL